MPRVIATIHFHSPQLEPNYGYTLNNMQREQAYVKAQRDILMKMGFRVSGKGTR